MPAEPNVIGSASPQIYRYRDELCCHVFRAQSFAAGAAVLFHGGGWASGKPEMLYPLAKFLASHNITSICVEYRLAWVHHSSVADAIVDAKDAAGWICSHAENLGFRPKIIFCGASAGALLAFHAAMRFRTETVGMCLFNPVVDTSKDGFINKQLPREGDISISPLHMLGGYCRQPPCMILHAKDDSVIPPEHVLRFSAAYNGTIEVDWFASGGHGFFHNPMMRENFNARVKEFADRVIGDGLNR